MKIMILGGSGNISSAIVTQLLEKNHEVVCYNRGQNRAEPLPKAVRQLHGDRRADRTAFEALMRAENPDAAIDMICFAQQDAESDLRAFPQVKKMVYCSTVCVYGLPGNRLPLTEEMEPTPTTGYGAGKKAAEDVFMRAYRDTGFPVTILRPSTTYGNQVGLVSSVGENSVWLDRVKKGKPVLVCGSGNNLHQFMHARDAAQAFVQAVDAPHTAGQIYNLVGTGYTDWNTFYATGMKILGQTVPILGVSLDILQALGAERFGYACDIFAHNAYYSNAKLLRDFPDFTQRVDLESGMREVIAWCEAHGTIPACEAYPVEERLVQALLAIKTTILK